MSVDIYHMHDGVECPNTDVANRLLAENRKLREIKHCAEQFLLTWDAAARCESVSNDEMLGRAHGLRQALAAGKQDGRDAVSDHNRIPDRCVCEPVPPHGVAYEDECPVHGPEHPRVPASESNDG